MEHYNATYKNYTNIIGILNYYYLKYIAIYIDKK